ncbi:MAG: exosortase H-associated membrane protein [Ottowia sp.]|uniref:exosortase H-associated membrane protein n=1 Tax=Ottowia sp. TaxID=1898956 RepID=UPI003C7408FB
MRATLIGRFLLFAVLGLIVLLPLWYWAAPWLAALPIWVAGTVMKAIFPWVDSFEHQGVKAILVTLVQVRMKGPQGDVFGELVPEVSYPTYGYGLVLLWAMLIASHPRRWWLKGLIGSLLLVPAQAWCICFQWLRDVVVLSGPSGAAYLKYPSWANEVVVYGYQFGFLMLTPVAPILLWLMFDKRFVAALWLEAALADKPEPAREKARMH